MSYHAVVPRTPSCEGADRYTQDVGILTIAKSIQLRLALASVSPFPAFAFVALPLALPHALPKPTALLPCGFPMQNS